MPKDFSIFPYSFSAPVSPSFNCRPNATSGLVGWQANRQTDRGKRLDESRCKLLNGRRRGNGVAFCLQTYAYKYLLSYVSAPHVRSRSSSISRTFSHLSFCTLIQPSSLGFSGRWAVSSGQFINVGVGKAFCESERWKVVRRIGSHLQNTHCKYISGFRKCISVSAGADKVLQWQTRAQTHFSSVQTHTHTHTNTDTHKCIMCPRQMHLLAIQPIWLHNFDAIYCIAWLSWLPTWKLIGFHLIWFSLAYSCWLIIKCPAHNRVILRRLRKLTLMHCMHNFSFKFRRQWNVPMASRFVFHQPQPSFALPLLCRGVGQSNRNKNRAPASFCIVLWLRRVCHIIFHTQHVCAAKSFSPDCLTFIFPFVFLGLFIVFCMPVSLFLSRSLWVCVGVPCYVFRHCIYIFVSTLKIPARLHGWYRCLSPFKAINDSSQWRYCTWSAESSVAGFTIAFGSHKKWL